MLCQHAAGFNQIDASFSKHFSLTAMQYNCNIDWGLSRVFLCKKLLFQTARKVSAKTPTHGFKDLLLWNFLRPHCLVNGTQARSNTGVCESPASHGALTSSPTVLHIRRYSRSHGTDETLAMLWRSGLSECFTTNKQKILKGSLLCLIHLTAEYKVRKKCMGSTVIFLCQLRSAAAALSGTLSDQLPERRRKSVGQDVFALFHLLHNF